ncbi:MAG: hypothetical protein IT572_01825 [Deltaproteobacteria bacterium]|nr:hypothetical protein [Deltaproteobacteria bacterium]
MKKLFLLALALGAGSADWARAQTQPNVAGSGIYQKLTLGVDPSQEFVTGYYEDVYEPPNMASSECRFYLYGKKTGNQYAVTTWLPGEKKSKTSSGQLTFYTANSNYPSVLLKLDELSRDCTQLNPKLGKEEGALLDKNKGGAWTEVRIVKNPKSHYFQNPDPASPTRSPAKRGTVLAVSARQGGWAQVQADQKPKGWIPEADLYPRTPEETSAAAAAPQVETPVSAPIKAAAAPAIAAPQSAPAAAVPSTTTPATQAPAESKSALLQRLKTLNAEAFALALQALKNPAGRASLAERRGGMEQELNAILSRLNQVDPSAYRKESPGLFETFLDLQYVKQDQQVVSLRLKAKMQEPGK